MIYFDNAATSRYKPPAVKKAIRDALKHSANPGRGTHIDAIRGAMILHETRECIADFVQAKKANVIFTKNCSEALNLALLGTAKLGGHVVTTAWEHNSVLRPLFMLKKEGLISLSVLEGENGVVTAKNIEGALREKTYLVAVTAMSNVTGITQPIEKIGDLCAAKGIQFLVDGAQALGHRRIRFDSSGIDYLCGAGHKSLHGIQGTGFLVYHKRGFVNPLMYGGTGTESHKLLQPDSPPESLETGTLNLPGIAAMKEGVLWTKDHFDEINDRSEAISHFLHESLRAIPEITLYSFSGSPMVTFDVKGRDNGEIADLLSDRFSIALRAGLHCAPLAHKALGTADKGLIRAGIGANNTMRDAKALLKAIVTLLSENRQPS